MLKKSLVVSAILVASLNAGMFGDLASSALGGGSSAPTVSGNDVKAVLTTFQQAETGLNNSVKLIDSALGDKAQVAKFDAQEKSINAMPNGSEKDAATKILNEDRLAEAKKISDSKDTQDKAKKLSSEQKAKVGISISNLLLVALKDTEGLTRAKALVASISSNPSAAMQFASDLPKLKDIVTTVPTQVSSLGTITSGLVKVAQSADIKYNANPKTTDNLTEVSDSVAMN